jgi:alkylated DNA repair dioxygenase AlkB
LGRASHHVAMSSLKHASQMPLFGRPVQARRDLDFSAARRLELDATSWIEHVPGWYAGHAEMFDALMKVPRWTQRRRPMYGRDVEEPRLTAEVESLPDTPFPAMRAMADAFMQRYSVRYDSVWMNLYRDHRDSTAWHGDWGSCKWDICVVPVVSFGATRRFFIRPKDGGRSLVFVVSGGDLIVMGGRCQKDWVNAVPKESMRTGPRISINFGSSEQNTPEPRDA